MLRQTKENAYQALPIAERRTFYVRDDYPKHLHQEVESIYSRQAFYLNLPPIKGATQAIKDLLSLGHDVRICTSPLNAYRYCIMEKYEWVGRGWVQRIKAGGLRWLKEGFPAAAQNGNWRPA